MDTTTKMFYIACKDRVYSDFLRVMLSVIDGKITPEIVLKAKRIGEVFPEIWDANTWFKMVGGIDLKNLDEKTILLIQKEIQDDFLDFED